MKKMRGRPRIGGEKTENFMLRISPEEKKMLEFVSWKTGKSRAEVLRSGLIDQYTREQSRDWNILYIHFVRPFGAILFFVYTFLALFLAILFLYIQIFWPFLTIFGHFILYIHLFLGKIVTGKKDSIFFVYTNFLPTFGHFCPLSF